MGVVQAKYRRGPKFSHAIMSLAPLTFTMFLWFLCDGLLVLGSGHFHVDNDNDVDNSTDYFSKIKF